MENKNILAIETSCDETAVAVIRNGKDILSNQILTQMDLHAHFGGVVPEIASRQHEVYIPAVVDQALKEAHMTFSDIDAIAVTFGPGLVGALLVGVSFAKALAFAQKKPLIGVHHIEGHIYANFLAHSDIDFPALCLVVSGGHTNIVQINHHGDYESIAVTRDDAAGEAYDKVARSLGLSYPGGPKIDALSKKGNQEAVAFPKARFDDSLDFSFSGLKSAVLNYLNQKEMKGEAVSQADVAASFQKAVVDVLVERTMEAAENTGIHTIMMAGGVSANSALREKMTLEVEKRGYKLYYPPLALCTDNAAMIGAAAYYKLLRQETADWYLDAVAHLPFSEYMCLTK